MPTNNENGSRRALSVTHPRSAPWTAARCNRTLRQLTKFLTKLEKWHKDFNKRHAESAQSRHHDSARRPLSVKQRRKSAPKSFSYEYDPEWVSQSDAQPRKRQKQYKRKHHRDQPESKTLLERAVRLPKTPHVVKHQPGTIPIDTPLIAGTIQSGEDDSFRCKEHRRQRTCRRNIFKQKVVLDLGDERDYDAIVQALPNILETFLDTTQDYIAEQSGARSLLAMCQRKMPDCIVEEQTFYDALQDDDSEEFQVAPQLFSELEDLYSTGTGWKPLRNLVRSYGLRLLCDAIKTGHLSLDTAASTIRQTGDLGHLDACECFSEAFLHAAVSNAEVHGWRVSLLRWQQTIDDWLRKDDLFGPIECRNMMICKILAIRRTLDNQQNRLLLPLLSFNTDIVRYSIASLTGGGSATAIGASFLYDFLLQSMNIYYQGSRSEVHSLRLSIAGEAALSPKQSDTFQNHLHVANLESSILSDHEDLQQIQATAKSIITILTSTILIRQRENVSDDTVLCSTLDLIKSLIIRIQQQQFLLDSSLPPSNSTTSFYILLATILLRNHFRDPINPDSLFFETNSHDTFSANPTLLDLSTAFILDIAHCCGRVSRTDGYPFLQHIISQLTSFIQPSPPSSPSSLKTNLMLHTIAAEAAASFAQRHDRPSYYKWATEIQRAFSAMTKQLCPDGEPQTPTLAMARNRKPYRWDESIEEWIAETPFLARERRSPSPSPPSPPLQQRSKNVLGLKRNLNVSVAEEHSDDDNVVGEENMPRNRNWKRKRHSAPHSQSQRRVGYHQEGLAGEGESEDELSIL